MQVDKSLQSLLNAFFEVGGNTCRDGRLDPPVHPIR